MGYMSHLLLQMKSREKEFRRKFANTEIICAGNFVFHKQIRDKPIATKVIER